ncbi:MAG: nitrous oxide-stimulated promoter family protein [Fusobacteria bacterium]|nr:nitrous oxide-stimulated promoter family protein [Fusobacteriota bacterium]
MYSYLDRRLNREIKTLKIMVEMYCKKVHNDVKPFCEKCQESLDYVISRVENCPKKSYRGICKGCKIHCYKDVYREEIKKIMRFSGPRLIMKHPILALLHILDGVWIKSS